MIDFAISIMGGEFVLVLFRLTSQKDYFSVAGTSSLNISLLGATRCITGNTVGQL
jgi:hypothetical protein